MGKKRKRKLLFTLIFIGLLTAPAGCSKSVAMQEDASVANASEV